MEINAEIYQSVRKVAAVHYQDNEDRLHDAMVFLLEHPGVTEHTDADGRLTVRPVENPAGLAVLHMRGRVRNARRKLVAESLDQFEEFVRDRVTALRAEAQQERRTLVREILRTLSPKDRMIAILHMRGLSHVDIARQSGVGPDAIRKRLARMAE